MIDFDALRKLHKQSAGGHQLKEADGEWWYKMDSHGYESAAEDACSKMNSLLGVDSFVKYEICTALYKGLPVRACRSRNFVPQNHKLMSIDELAYASGRVKLLNDFMITTPRATLDRFLRTVKAIAGTGGIVDYLVDMLWLDVLYFNIDRHVGNMSIFVVRDGLKPVPYYDFGESLFADTRVFSCVTEGNASSIVSMCQINPFQMSIREMAYALSCVKKFPWDLSDLQQVSFEEYGASIAQRMSWCLDATVNIIKEVC